MSKTESEHACAISSKHFVPFDDEEESTQTGTEHISLVQLLNFW